MTEIAQLFESALRQNRANLLRKAAINTVAKMPAQTTLHELLTSEAGSSIRELTLVELREALAGFVVAAQGAGSAVSPVSKRTVAAGPAVTGSAHGTAETLESREARLYRQIIEACGHEPKTIGQLAKVVDVDVVELRGYLAWMKKMGKIDSSGRARATRYHLPQS
jgi:predicted Rossmann fold nucleotide-binding protein DprA/Smf involved in DNA uptake